MVAATTKPVFFFGILSLGARWLYHAHVLLIAIFLTIYAVIVCPFIDSLPFTQVAGVLLGIGLFQIFLREFILIVAFPRRLSHRTTRHYSLFTFATWKITGLLALGVHAYLYREFPIESHLKLLVGYLALGGGFVATVETQSFASRMRQMSTIQQDPVRFSYQFLRLVTIFIVIPNIVLVLIIFRFAYEGYILKGAGYEMIFLMLVFALFALYIAHVYGRELARDTKALVRGLRRVGEGNFNIHVDDSRPDELGFVARRMNRMVEELSHKQAVEQAFGRFVNPVIAKRFLQDIGKRGSILNQGRRQRATVLMCDIRNFASLTEKMEPSKVTELLNAYFQEMVKQVHNNHGIIDKFIGDAFMAVFGILEDEDPEQAVKNAYACGRNLIDSLEKLNVDLAKKNLPTIKNGVGIHTGEVVAGYLGSPERLEFTVIGASVNLASRIETATKQYNVPILLSEAVAKHLQQLEDRPVKIARLQLKGFSYPIDLFTHPDFSSAKKLDRSESDAIAINEVQQHEQ